MIYRVVLVLAIIDSSFSYDNTSSIFDGINVINKSAFKSRQSKLISFNTLDENISMELSFTVPFISIPIKKSLSLLHGSMANINIGALFLTGGIVAGVTVITPFLLRFFNKQTTYPYWTKPENYRNDQDASEQWKYLEYFEKILSVNNIDPTSCMQRVLCAAVSESVNNIREGKASSSDKIFDGIVSSPWLTDQLQGTPMYFALQNGLNGKNCYEIYTQCNIPEKSIESILGIFRKL